MSLLQRVERAQQPADANGAGTPVAVPPPVQPSSSRIAREEMLRAVRLRLQAEVMTAFDSLLDLSNPAELQGRVEGIVDRVVIAENFIITRDERARLVDELVGEIGGLGPLEPLLADETITEVMVNGPNHLYIERGGKISRVDHYFLNDEHVLRIIDRIITRPAHRRVEPASGRPAA
jgi:pilus assembly protein CpaF